MKKPTSVYLKFKFKSKRSLIKTEADLLWYAACNSGIVSSIKYVTITASCLMSFLDFLTIFSFSASSSTSESAASFFLRFVAVAADVLALVAAALLADALVADA